jgi:hypothetical protein
MKAERAEQPDGHEDLPGLTQRPAKGACALIDHELSEA